MTIGVRYANAAGAATSFTGNEWDGGLKMDIAGFEGVLYGYTGSGVGTTGILILPTSDLGQKRDSDGGYVQVTYKFDKVKLGVSYGESRLKGRRFAEQRSGQAEQVRCVRRLLQPDQEHHPGRRIHRYEIQCLERQFGR